MAGLFLISVMLIALCNLLSDYAKAQDDAHKMGI